MRILLKIWSFYICYIKKTGVKPKSALFPGTKIPRWIPPPGFHKQGYKDSNLEMTESESVALPFGDSPLFFSEYYYNTSYSKKQVLFCKFSWKICMESFRLLFTRHCSARRFRTFCAEIPSFSARNRIFLRFLCLAKRVTGHGVNSNVGRLQPIPDVRTGLDKMLKSE